MRRAPRRSGSRGPWEAEDGTEPRDRQWRFTRHHLEPLPRPRLPARPGALSRGARGSSASTERNATHLQVNRDLLRRVRRGLSAPRGGTSRSSRSARRAGPRRWPRACGAEVHRSLTSRNWLASVRGPLARRNPDLIGSWGGRLEPDPGRGRALAAGLRERRELVLAPPAGAAQGGLHPARPGLCVANLHASGPDHARRAPTSAAPPRPPSPGPATTPLILGRRLQPPPEQTATSPRARRAVRPRGHRPRPDSIDHLLSRGLEIVEPARAWPAARARGAMRRASPSASPTTPRSARDSPPDG